jgi:hypothetical protein
MGGERLTDEEIEIVLGKVNYPSLVRGVFKDISDVSTQVDAKISHIKKELSDIDRELAHNAEELGG